MIMLCLLIAWMRVVISPSVPGHVTKYGSSRSWGSSGMHGS
ncbi:hypothetical protein L195_g043982, partial [Trifolium pratense]